MLALDIEIDGEKFVTAGAEDWSILTAAIFMAHRSEKNDEIRYLQLHVEGLSRSNKENVGQLLQWSEVDLKIGNIITIKVIDTLSVDAPERYPSD